MKKARWIIYLAFFFAVILRRFNLRKQGVEVIEKVDTQPFQAIIADQVRKSFVEKHGDELLKKVDALAQ